MVGHYNVPLFLTSRRPSSNTSPVNYVAEFCDGESTFLLTREVLRELSYWKDQHVNNDKLALHETQR